MRRRWRELPESPWPERFFRILCIAIALGVVGTAVLLCAGFGVLAGWIEVF